MRSLLEAFWQSGWMLANRGHPTRIPETWSAVLGLPVLWIVLSAWSDTQGLESSWLRGLSSALLEVVILTGLLRALCVARACQDRYPAAWVAMSGISAWVWLVTGLLLSLGVPHSFVGMASTGLALCGYGYLLKVLDSRIQFPYLLAGQGLIASWVLWYLVAIVLFELPA